MNYDLNKLSQTQQKTSTLAGLKKLLQLIAHEKKVLLLGFTCGCRTDDSDF